MKKLLIMASLFWPQKNSGGPPVSILNLVMSIQDHFDIYIISKNHEIGEREPLKGVQNGWNDLSFGKAYYVPRGAHTFRNITALIEQVQPDVIYQNSFFSYDDLLPVLAYKKRHPQVKVIVAPRGEFYPKRLRCGSLKKQLYGKLVGVSGLLKDVYFQGTGADECAQEHTFLGIPEDHLLDIQNLAVVSREEEVPMQKTPGTLKLVYIARIHPTKNTLQAIQWLAQIKGQVEYDIYGPIENQEYWKQCRNVIQSLPGNIQVRHCGMVEHDHVAQVIAGYHAYYMPTSGENFGHSIVESLLVGRPVVISDQTPWTDVSGVGGYAYPLSQEEKFPEALHALCAMEQEEFDTLCAGARKYIAEKLNTQQTIAQYIAAFEGENHS